MRLLRGSALLAIGAFAVLGLAQTPPPDAPPAAPPPVTTTHDSALVAAAKKSGKPKIPKKVITNKDVKKSKGRLAVSSPPPLPAEDHPKAAADPRSPTEKSDARYQARRAADDRAAAAEKKVTELQNSLATIEQSYYAEKDLNLRDDVIQKRFAQTKRQLEAAQKELADARDAVAAASKQ